MSKHSMHLSPDALDEPCDEQDTFDELADRFYQTSGPDTGPVRPLTRREARALREVQAGARAKGFGAPEAQQSGRDGRTETGHEVAPEAPASAFLVTADTVPVEVPADTVPTAIIRGFSAQAAPSDPVNAADSTVTAQANSSASTLEQKSSIDISCFAKPQCRVEATKTQAPVRRKRGRSIFAAGAAAALAVPVLLCSIPAANALASGQAATQAQQTQTTPDGHTAAQVLSVPSNVSKPTVQQANYIAGQLASIVVSHGGVAAQVQAPVLASALQVGGNRQKIVETALSYLGAPYVLGGSTMAGIDCSGLTMEAYLSVGISMPHLVSSQDRLGTVIPQSQAQPGDLVVFNDNAHVALYLGGNLVVAAPDWGQNVQVQSLSNWSGIGYHFTRILSASQSEG